MQDKTQLVETGKVNIVLFGNTAKFTFSGEVTPRNLTLIKVQLFKEWNLYTQDCRKKALAAKAAAEAKAKAEQELKDKEAQKAKDQEAKRLADLELAKNKDKVQVTTGTVVPPK